MVALYREETPARNCGPEQLELLPQQKLCVPPADLTGEEVPQMDAAVKMHRLIDGGNILDRLRGGVVQMGIRDQRDGQIAIAGQHVPNRLFCFLFIAFLYHISNSSALSEHF